MNTHVTDSFTITYLPQPLVKFIKLKDLPNCVLKSTKGKYYFNISIVKGATIIYKELYKAIQRLSGVEFDQTQEQIVKECVDDLIHRPKQKEVRIKLSIYGPYLLTAHYDDIRLIAYRAPLRGDTVPGKYNNLPVHIAFYHPESLDFDDPVKIRQELLDQTNVILQRLDSTLTITL